MAVAVVPLVVALLGALIYAISSNAKASEMGRILFFVGTFWLISSMVTKQLHF